MVELPPELLVAEPSGPLGWARRVPAGPRRVELVERGWMETPAVALLVSGVPAGTGGVWVQ